MTSGLHAAKQPTGMPAQECELFNSMRTLRLLGLLAARG